MRRIVFFSGVVSFAMAFLGTLVASTLAVPAVVGAQEARIRAEQFTVVGDNGADRINLHTGPGIAADLEVLDANGVRRAVISTGRSLVGDAPDNAFFVIWATDGTTPLVAASSARGRRGDRALENRLQLNDWQGRARVVLRVEEDGTPSIQMWDPGGNVTWEAK